MGLESDKRERERGEKGKKTATLKFLRKKLKTSVNFQKTKSEIIDFKSLGMIAHPTYTAFTENERSSMFEVLAKLFHTGPLCLFIVLYCPAFFSQTKSKIRKN